MRSKVLSVIIALILVLVGCQNPANDTTTDESKRGDNAIERTRTTHDNDRSITENLRDRNFKSNHRNSNNRQDGYDVSKEAAEKIVEEIPDVDRAYVLTTRHNAYVAATLDRKNMTEKDNLSYNDRQRSSAGMNIRNVNDRNVRNRTVNEGDSNERRQDNHMANKKDNVRHDMMGKRDVESDELTDEVKNQIADIVQEVDKDIKNVYVSTNPDFFDLSENYVNDLEAGKPVRGFFDQIGNTIERIFPQNKR